jgi:hypothetical protein
MRVLRFAATLIVGVLLPLSQALAFDHSKLNGLLSGTVSGGRVDYAAVRARQAELDAYLTAVATASGTQSLGFYINAYNALVLDALLDSGATLPAKVTDLAGFFDKKYYKVGGKEMTLNDLETMVRNTYRDPRIHFALNCGAKSCPPLRSSTWPEDQAALDKALSDATIAFLNGSGVKIDDTRKEIQVTKLMDWYGKDFTDNAGTVQAFCAKYVTDATKAGQLKAGVAANYTVTFQSYNWAPNSK